jgi:hypothetical protein
VAAAHGATALADEIRLDELFEPFVLSPELALVDADLAAWARSLPNPPLSARSASATTPRPKITPGLANSARSRLMEGALADEVLSLIEPPRRLRRRVSLVASSSAAGAVALFVAQLVLTRGSV